ncbi:MAG: hypothetical protein JRJ12_03055 [Deltaproteobacteria bacterium]|nr:hypothetical protein [Deltaproteobacteria bacterium]MBW2071778.1 hypothetical protein [Deltaproteobacteria bacterium]
MTVTPFQVQRVLRTYGRQLSRNQQLLINSALPRSQAPDTVSISASAKRLHSLKRTAAEVMTSREANEEVEALRSEALARLSREEGENLELFTDEDNGMLFAVVDDKNSSLRRYLPDEESGRLANRLSSIIMEMIDSGSRDEESS